MAGRMKEYEQNNKDFVQGLWDIMMLIHDNILNNEEKPEIRELITPSGIKQFYKQMHNIALYLKRDASIKTATEEDIEFLNAYLGADMISKTMFGD